MECMLGWLLTEELAAGADEDNNTVVQWEPEAWTVTMERCFALMDTEVTSAGKRASCQAR